MSARASFALQSLTPPHFVFGSSGPTPHGRGGLLRLGITEAPPAWAPVS